MPVERDLVTTFATELSGYAVEIARLRSQLARAEAVIMVARTLRFGAYPAHGSGFVHAVCGGNVNDLKAALAAYDQEGGGDAV